MDALAAPETGAQTAPTPARAAAETRLPGVDSIRFWLAMWVFYSHFFPRMDEVGKATPLRAALSGLIHNFFNGPAAVIGFFLISGLCIHWPYRSSAGTPAAGLNAAKFYARRYVRIAIPLLAALAIVKLTRSDMMWFYDSILWSLVAELAYYTLYPALLRAIRRFGFGRVIAAAYAVCGLILALHPRALNIYDPGAGLVWAMCLPTWLLGCHLAESAPRTPTPRAATVWMFRILIWGLSFAASVLRFHTPVGYPVSLTLLGPAMYWWLKLEFAWHRRDGAFLAFEFPGQFSYSIYLMHGLAVSLVALLIARANAALLVVAQTCAVLVVSYVFFLLVERPSHLLARRVARLIR